ncbi:hypothetical protein GIB67_006306 [Kingdonia uniflora]|uniref:Nucleoporin protein Ndc1-Nup n=1 Tax=Kingdonia uniflora TaxID=39325 RepID=A0A7J7P6A0_9MAGN|nr:hypothetical protein GIB67_006306 [Kingdonia uniflora]
MKMSSFKSFENQMLKDRFLGFLIWESIFSSAIFVISKTIFLSPFTQNPFSPSFLTIISFLAFHLSLLIFSTSLHTISSPCFDRPASIAELAFALGRFVFNSVVGGASPSCSDAGARRRLRTLLGFVVFVVSAVVAGALGVLSLCRNVELGLRGLLFGLIYGGYYVYKQRWVLKFPIVQRPAFFSFKMGLPSAIGQALLMSTVAFLCSSALVVFLPVQFKSHSTKWKSIVDQVIFYVGSFTVCLCWELCHYLHQVTQTKSCIFAPPKGSAAAESNPSKSLFEALETSDPRSLLKYLAYFDLCIVCDSNVDTWRRDAFFEETGVTYKRVIKACLRPLEELTSKLSVSLEDFSAKKTDQLANQLRSPSDTLMDLTLHEPFNELQLCAWCVRSAGALTAHSHKDDAFGVAQLSGCNADVVSTLLSCLLAIEACLGKKTNLQAPHSTGAANIKWATSSTGRRDAGDASVAASKRRRGPLHAKAYAMADILRTSIYNIVSEFRDEMLVSNVARNLDKDWIPSGKPLHGSCQLLLQRLVLFLDDQAN